MTQIILSLTFTISNWSNRNHIYYDCD